MLFRSISGSGDVNIGELSDVISKSYNITPLLFIIPIIVVVMIAKKIPAIIVLFTGTLLGILGILIFQPEIGKIVTDSTVSSFTDRIVLAIKSAYGPISPQTGFEMLDSLVSTKGMSGML